MEIVVHAWLISHTHGMGWITIFPIALLVLRKENASTVWENGKGLLGSNIGFTLPFSK